MTTVSQENLPLIETQSPTDEAAVAAIVRAAGETHTPIYPIGGGTRQDYGVQPTRPGIGLEMNGLNRIIDYPANDLTITVEAGVTLAALDRQLAAHGQRLPVDVPEPERATVGGAIMTNTCGPRRYGCGTVRDYLLGFRAVDGEGTAFSGGGRVVKNAAGYNMPRLLTGSLGTLGVLTQATLMVRPRPQTSAMLACSLPNLDAAERLLALLRHTATLPVAIELLAGQTDPHDSVLGSLCHGDAVGLLVGFEGSGAEVDWMREQLGSEWRAAGVSTLVTVTGADVGPLWDWLIGRPAEVQVHVLCSDMVHTMAAMRELIPGVFLHAHAGNGVIRAKLPECGTGSASVAATCGTGSASVAGLAKLLGTLRESVSAVHGKVTLLATPPGIELTRHDVWGSPGSSGCLMQAIHERFDPLGILNPQRFSYEK